MSNLHDFLVSEKERDSAKETSRKKKYQKKKYEGKMKVAFEDVATV